MKEKYYTYTFSNDASWILWDQSKIARCSWKKGRKMSLYTSYLEVEQGDRMRKIHLNNIVSISLVFRRLMLPIIIGGVIASLGFLSVMKGSSTPALTLAIVIGAVLLMYYGWQGSFTLAIKLKGGTQINILLNEHEKTDKVKGFVDFAQNYIRGRKSNKIE